MTARLRGGALSIAVLLFQLGILGGCGASSRPPADEVNVPLSSFVQQITSSVHELRLQHNQAIQLPVTIKNTGPDTWSSAGKAPVVVSYKWSDNGKMLPIEGERTLLPRPLRSGESVPLEVKVVAPPQGKQVLLKVTLVQEGVVWFISKGGQPLEIPTTLQP